MANGIAITPGQPCKTCERPLRPNKTIVEDYPGTVMHAGRGLCARCAVAERRAAKPRQPKPQKTQAALPTGTPCVHCKKPMRHRRLKAAQAPGTVLHRLAGYCETCYKHGHAAHLTNPDLETRKAAKSTPSAKARFRKQEQLPPRPENLTPDQLQLRIAIEDLINSRRRRGIPPEVRIPPEMGLAA